MDAVHLVSYQYLNGFLRLYVSAWDEVETVFGVIVESHSKSKPSIAFYKY